MEDVLKLYYLLKERGFDVESSFKTVSSIEEYNKNICDIHKEYGLFATPSIHNAWGMCIVLFRYSWSALYQHNKEEAGRVAQKWWGKPDIIFKRLALFAASQGAIESSLWGEWILENDAAYLWEKEGAYIEYRREIMRLLTHQGKNLSGEIQETLEKMILDGKEENEIWLRLKKLEFSGLELGEESKKFLEKLSKENPSWQLYDDQREEFNS